MRLLILFMISIMILPIFADEVKPADKLPEVTKPVEKVNTTEKEKQPEITIIPGDGMNLAVEDMINPHYVVVKLNSPAHNWFAGQFKNLPTDKETAIGLSMDDNDTTGNKADVSKWKGLMPVMTYGDPTKYETYEWYTKDEKGRWVSGDPFKKGDDKYAGTGKVPTQAAIPKEAAEDFLSKDGKYWQPWREVDNAEALPNLNIFRIKQRFKFDTATVCMRVPYTYTYQQEFIKRLKEAKIPGVFVDEIGETKEKRKLQVIRIDDIDTTKNPEECRTILTIAREHATEHASSWGLHGMITFALSSQSSDVLRKNVCWLFVPILDPDGSASGIFDRLTEQFCRANEKEKPKEIFSYAHYLANYIDKRYTIDICFSLHNVEANETSNLHCPFINKDYIEVIREFNQSLFKKVAKESYLTGNPLTPWDIGYEAFRLPGWCNSRFGSLDIAFECNDRYPANLLSIARIQQLGELLSNNLHIFLISKDGDRIHEKSQKICKKRFEMSILYYEQRQMKSRKRTDTQVLSLGF